MLIRRFKILQQSTATWILPAPMTDNTQYDSKYERLLDEQVWSFIHKSNSYFPADAANHSIQQQRAWYTQMCGGFQQLATTPVTRIDYSLSERYVPVREYLPLNYSGSNATVIYYHGGGFVVGNLNSHDDVCAAICTHSGFKVISVDYKLSPEHKHPEAFLDAYAIFSVVAQATDSKVVLAGDSAGATLAACVSAHSRAAQKQPDAQILIYPYLGAPTHQGSALEHGHAPLLTSEDMEFYQKIRFAPNQPVPDDDTFAPLWGQNFSNLPATRIFSAECDPLRDDGALYAEKINHAGGNACSIIEAGLVHGYLRARHNSDKAKESFVRILDAIKQIGEY